MRHRDSWFRHDREESYFWRKAGEGDENERRRAPELSWERIQRLDGFRHMHLFNGPDTHVTVNDPIQGQLGDCWLIAAMAAVAD